MCGTRIEKEVEFFATNLANKTKCMSTMQGNGNKFMKACSIHMSSSAHALGFVGQVCSTKFYLLFYPSSTRVQPLLQFILHIFLLSATELAWSQVIK
jgi:hypothetical protein